MLNDKRQQCSTVIASVCCEAMFLVWSWGLQLGHSDNKLRNLVISQFVVPVGVNCRHHCGRVKAACITAGWRWSNTGIEMAIPWWLFQMYLKDHLKKNLFVFEGNKEEIKNCFESDIWSHCV